MARWTEKGYDIQINTWYGRLGNNMLQLCCALFIARETKSTLKYPSHSFIKDKIFDFREPQQLNCNKRIQNKFFGQDQLSELKSKYTQNTQCEISRQFIYPLLKLVPESNWSPISPKEDFSTTLVIHIRSGDAMKKGVNKNYVQPPLASYKKAILYSDLHGVKFSHVLIVTEKDNLNPCTSALKKFCDSIGQSCYIQRGSLSQDVSTICRARYFVTSQSSFAWSFLRCNPFCKIAFIPNIRFPNTPIFPSDSQISSCPFEQHFYGLPDYICAKEWLYSPEQLKLMIEYPVEKIPVKIVKSISVVK